MNTLALLIAAVLLIIFLVLHNTPARSEEVPCDAMVASVLEKKTTFVLKDCGKGDLLIVPAAEILPVVVELPMANPPTPRDKPCHMKGRVRIDGECWIPRRVKLMKRK